MRKSKIYGIVGTTTFAGLVLLLFFLVRIASIQDNYTEPVLINFGDSEDGVGAAVASPAPPTSVVPPPPSTTKKQESNDENLASQANESPVQTVEKKKTEIKKVTPKQLEENRKKILQDLLKQQQAKAQAVQNAAIADKARKMGSIFGSNHGFVSFFFRNRNCICIRNTTGADRDKTTSLHNFVVCATIYHQILDYRESTRTPRFDGNGFAVFELTHVLQDRSDSPYGGVCNSTKMPARCPTLSVSSY